MTPMTPNPYSRPNDMALAIATHLSAAKQPMSRMQITHELNLHEFSPNTITRWLQLAVNQGWASAEGNTSATNYRATPQFRANHARMQLAQPTPKRRKVGYNDEMLDSYQPNKSHYLSSSNRDRLQRRSPIGSMPPERLSDRDTKMFTMDLSFASSLLEGNKYDHASSIKLFEEGVEMPGASDTDRIMLLNHYAAAQYMIDSVKQAKISPNNTVLSAYEIRSLHAILSADLLADPRHSGNLRTSHVEISYSSYIPLDIPEAIKQRFETIIKKAGQIQDPFEQAFFLLVHIPYLQPFEDCNKRTSRIACNLPLLRASVLPMSWMDTPQKDYTDAILSIYEFNEPSLLEEVFVEGYMRTTERFEINNRMREPGKIAMQYRNEIRECIRNRVLHDDATLPDHIPKSDLPSFALHLETQIEAIKDAPFSAIRFGLKPEDVEAWCEHHQIERSRERSCPPEP